jgi:hypothetical protein
MRSTENETRPAGREVLETHGSPAHVGHVRRDFLLFLVASLKWLFAIALIFRLALSPDLLFAQSRKARSADGDFCERESLPLTIHQGLALIRVSINQQPMTFLVDSGGKTIINSDRVLLPVVQQIRTGTVTVTATETMDLWSVVRVNSFGVGGTEFRDSRILSRSLRLLETQLGQELDGIFGNDTLQLWDSVSLDYKHRALVLQRSHCGQPPSTESLFQLERDALRVGK